MQSRAIRGRVITDWMQARYGDVLDAATMRNRPNKVALGMSKTSARSRHELGGAALRLVVKGTTDDSRGIMLLSTRTDCPCCGQRSGKLVLNDSGRVRLRALRARRQRRLAA